MKIETIVLGGGCFWCTEAIFKMLKGVISVTPGYSGGKIKNPTYEQVCTEDTEHAEVIKIKYDPLLITLKDLLTVFFTTHNPTTKNKQGNDEGTQYRSIIFYTTEEQKKTSEEFINNIDDAVTEIKPLDVFYEAETYHKDYMANNPMNSYCQIIINPKLEKVQKEFSELLSKRTK